MVVALLDGVDAAGAYFAAYSGGIQRAQAVGAGGGDVVALPGQTGLDQTGNPDGSATIYTLPPWDLCLPEYHRW